jgi:ATP-binding cassette subfamily A (ABC1) protein 3
MPTFQPYGGAGWRAACLLPPSAVSLFASVLLRLEGGARGIRWGTLSLGVTNQDPFSAATVFYMLAADVFIYGILTWYFDKVKRINTRPCSQLFSPLSFFPVVSSRGTLTG